MTTTRITLLGGVNEIGGNKFLVEEGEDRLLLDFGTSIGARNSLFEEFVQPRTNSVLRDLLRLDLLPRVDGIYRDDLLEVARATTDKDLPASAAEWRRSHDGRDFVQGILITHAHVDHFQDLSFVDPAIPVYATPTTRRMLEAIEEVRGADVQSEIVNVRRRSVGSSTSKSTFGEHEKVVTESVPRILRDLPESETHRVGNFEVTPVPVDHSVPGGCAFLVRTPKGKRIFYTGDVRFHGRLVDRTTTFLKVADGLEPDVMLSEGTRMDNESRDDEEMVERGVRDLVAEASGLVVTEFGWKDTTRFDTLQRAAAATGRTLLVDPRLAFLLHRLHDRADVPSYRVEAYDNVRAYVRRRESMLDTPGDYAKHECGYLTEWGERSSGMRRAWADGDEAFLAEAMRHYRSGVRARDVHENPDKYVVHLTFWSSSELLDLDPPPGSSWIRCAAEPYSEEMALTLDRQRRWLDQFGLAHNLPATGGADEGVLRAGGRVTHVSGHGARPDLEGLIKAARPKILVPVHTSEKSLDLFEDLGFDARCFRGAGYRQAGKGACVIEL